MAQPSKTVIASRTPLRRLGGWLRAALDVCALAGAGAREQKRKLLQTAAIVSAALIAAVQPSYWRRTIRSVFAREMLSSGVEAIGVVVVLATALGILLVVQYQAWLGQVVQSALLGPLLVTVVVREIAPILVNLVLIARSGSAIAATLALVHVSGEDRVAEGQGVDTLDFFVIPRVLALALSAFCLTIIFVACSVLSVYVFGQWIDAKTGPFWEFSQSTINAVATVDVVNLVLKSTIPALLTASISCAEGLGAGDTTAEVPRASRVAVQRSVVALFTVSALVSVATYS